jgi:flavin reductase (DIM6/NTAB) family NADH-FMN oxidoreductase RutF
MLSLDPKELSIPERHKYLLGAVGPRPIAFASTVDKDNRPNLAPFSFFNVFSSNPPILVFSPARSGRTGETKNTLDNVKEVPEVVINVVTYPMVHQMSLTSSPYEKGINEFTKAGFTEEPSDLIAPSRVKEAPVQFECKVNEVVSLGDQGAAGNLVICEVVRMHFDEAILDENKFVDQTKIDLVARMGGNWYARAHGEALFEIDKPLTTTGVGVDSLPEKMVKLHGLDGNDLGRLGNIQELPKEADINMILQALNEEPSLSLAKNLLDNGEPLKAYAVLMQLI